MSIKLIAELSMNYMGDMDLAKEMVVAAHESGADYAKFQTWKMKSLCEGDWDKDGRREVYAKSEMTEERHAVLSSFCKKTGIKFLTSCFSEGDLDLVQRYSRSVKIPSPECGNKDLVYKAIDKFSEVYISTGASLPSEWEDYAQYSNVYLLHCVSMYPCPEKNANLKRILSLKKLTDRVGYSGHCEGTWDAFVAIAMGAQVIEKHFTIDQSLPFRDNQIAILPKDLEMIRKFSRSYLDLVIDHGMAYQDCEQIVRDDYKGRWNGG